jgi:hypothetical protein
MSKLLLVGLQQIHTSETSHYSQAPPASSAIEWPITFDTLTSLEISMAPDLGLCDLWHHLHSMYRCPLCSLPFAGTAGTPINDVIAKRARRPTCSSLIRTLLRTTSTTPGLLFVTPLRTLSGTVSPSFLNTFAACHNLISMTRTRYNRRLGRERRRCTTYVPFKVCQFSSFCLLEDAGE